MAYAQCHLMECAVQGRGGERTRCIMQGGRGENNGPAKPQICAGIIHFEWQNHHAMYLVRACHQHPLTLPVRGHSLQLALHMWRLCVPMGTQLEGQSIHAATSCTLHSATGDLLWKPDPGRVSSQRLAQLPHAAWPSLGYHRPGPGNHSANRGSCASSDAPSPAASLPPPPRPAPRAVPALQSLPWRCHGNEGGTTAV